MVRFKKPPAKTFLERPHAHQTVISRHSVTPWLAFPRQIGHLARDQLGPVHAGLNPWLGGEQSQLPDPTESGVGPNPSTGGSVA
mgnify:CR=1 FL=1